MTSIFRVIKKFKVLLSEHQRIRILELAIMMIIGGFLDTLSVSLILPFMSAVMKSDELLDNKYVMLVCKVLKIESSTVFLIYLSILLAIVYVLKNIYLIFEYNIQYKFVFGNMLDMQKKLLQSFMSRPYEYFLNINSGEILRIITSDTTEAFNLLITILTIMTELVVSAMLIISILFIAPLVTISMVVLLIGLLLIIYFFIKPVLRRASLNRQSSSAEMNKWLIQSIQGIKEIKVMNKEYFFRHNYEHYGNIYVNALRNNSILGITPRFMIEGVSMGAFFIVTAVLIIFGVKLENIIPMLTAVALAATRLLPAINRISNCLAQIAYGEPMVDKVIENMTYLSSIEVHHNNLHNNQYDTVNDDFKDKIELKNIFYHYPNTNKNVLDGASICIPKGKTIGIIGASGSGKTTSVDILLGLLIPQSGSVFVDGKNIFNDLTKWHCRIGYIPQMIFMLDDTLLNNVAFGEDPEKIDREEVMRSIKEASLEGLVADLPEGLDTQIGERGVRLSGGQRQRIGIARALYHNPEILIFDEATSALDNDTEAEIIKSINSLKGTKTMIIIAHRMTTIESCDIVYRVESGNIERVQ
ncbi:ABC transporter ATP-binding protein [Pseudobutyrivibrio xylanivorans]|uniref:ABC-type bacteriocin/lantibiotic exporter, contains an N-terminal double-glycine peptidase domain n=1 Tax=Pseudobutyrivibrio xylanivorans TaxID=185007 RepID=A0A1G5S5R2_PSEXY|nr:ABC transporter ATP-binding protein [Pseudobutyrivibrio xylanivorans]SCZ81220.1 ABC-type bacteriocin/lantibiotic exporter, contains an N-terminal double-glycine peptidase domain [Pseudobutyrivibrio xylanivorans]